MKKLVKLFALVCLLVAVCCTVAGCSSGGSETGVAPPADQSAPVEPAHEIPEETLNAIRRELRGYFYGFDGNSTISVSDCDGALDIGLYYVGMVTRVPFPDYVNALSVQSTELAAEYDEDIYKISVQFTGGQGKSITGDSYDGISWELTDTYDDAINLSGQTIEDLVERYGCMDWFYNLSGDTEQSNVSNGGTNGNDEEPLPVGPVGGDGSFTLDSTVYVLSGTIDGEITYDPEANCIISIISADGFIQAFLEEYVGDSVSSVEHWETAKATYQSLDNATRKLIDTSCDSEVDTMFTVVDSQRENGYILMIQNGEITYDLIAAFVEQH